MTPKSAKGANAPRQTEEELREFLGGEPDTVPVLRVFPSAKGTKPCRRTDEEPADTGGLGVPVLRVFKERNSSGAFKISGSLDLDNAALLRDALLDGLPNDLDLALDLSGVEECDAAGLQVLLAAEKTAISLNKPFRVTGLSNAITEAAAELGLRIDRLARQG